MAVTFRHREKAMSQSIAQIEAKFLTQCSPQLKYCILTENLD